MEQEMLGKLITCGHANATHVCFCHNPAGHNPAGVHGETDKECTRYKKAHCTIAPVLVWSKYEFWVQDKAPHLWINKFLPKHCKELFPEEKLQKLRSWVR